MLIELLWDAGQPRQRPWAGGRELGETPVEDGGHVSCGAEVSSTGGNLQVEERVLAGLSRQAEQVCTQRRPGRLVGEPGHELVGSVERRHGLGAEELFGRDVEPVNVALDRLVEPHRRVLKLTQQGGGGDGRVVAGEDLLQGLGRSWGCDGFGPDHSVRVTVADDLEVEVVGVPAAAEHGVELLAGLLPCEQSVHGVGRNPLSAVDRGGVAETGRFADVVGGQLDGAVAAVVPDGQGTFSAEVGDGPPWCCCTAAW
jgi:hypothetical protein